MRGAEDIDAHVRIMIKPASIATAIRPDRFTDIHHESRAATLVVTEFESSTMPSEKSSAPAPSIS